MLLPAPQAVDVQEIQFKLHAKQNIFNEGDWVNNASLLSVSSTQGLLFAGNPNAAELKVFMLHNLVESQVLSKPPLVRSIHLPSAAICLGCSADGKMLAINYNHNGNGILQIYSVPSFTTSHIKSLYTVRLSPEDHVFALQLIWNPVLTNMLAVVLSNGALLLYTLKEGGQFVIHSLDKSQQVQCGCWSPKGKQIVLGFLNGKLQQFKPDLTPAKSIICPANVLATPFDTLAVHWLSTYQFAAIFLQQNEEAHPALYIVNAPKGGTPSYVCYDDVCYSTPGPRAHQFSFTHIAQWNILLVCSANGVEVGIIATKETGDTPQWVQYLLLDEARIELPLTESKDESFPLGFCFDTAATHQLVIGEQTLPIMPMVHVLSTHGHLVSFNFLNLTPNAADVCSPPLPVTDESGEFRELQLNKSELVTSNNNQNNAPVAAAADSTFSFTTSTPAQKDKTTSFFSGAAIPAETYFPQPAATAPVAFGAKPAEAAAKSTANVTGFRAAAAVPAPSSDLSGFALSKSNSAANVAAVDNKSKELNKPLYTVPPTFVPPVNNENAQVVKAEKPQLTQTQMNDDEITEVVRQMINVQIEAFDAELQHISKSFTTNIIGNLDEVKQYTRRLNDLQEIIEQANDREFEMDVQNLRHALSESYAMLAEVRSKMEQYNNTDITPLAGMTNFEAMDRRQVAKLQSYLAANEAQLQQVQLQIDTQWSNFQDLIRRNTKTKMHIPCLDGIYQRMTKLKDLVARQRVRLNCIHSKLKQQGFYYKCNADSAVEGKTDVGALDSLTDSILSLSISQAVQENRAKLSPQKLQSIRQVLRQRQTILLIKPRRPDRVDLNSEVILETKLRNQQQTQRELRAGATASLDKMLQQQTQTPTQSTAQAQQNAAFNFNANKDAAITMGLTKPTATKPTPPSTNASKPVSFGVTSSFVKPTAATSMPKLEQLEKPAFGAFNAPNFNFSLPKGTTVVPVTTAEPVAAVTPISFAAKVIGGDASKINGTKTFKPDISNTGFAALLPNTAAPFAITSSAASTNNNSNTVTERKVEELKPAVSSSAPVMPFSGFMSKATTNAAPSFNFSGLSGNAPAATTKSVFSGFSAAPLNTTSNNRKAETATVVSAFSGFGKAIGELGTLPSTLSSTNTVTTTTATTTLAAADSKQSFGVKTTATTAAAAISSVTATTSVVTTTTKTTDAADNLFSNLNICKPTTKEDADKPSTNVFGSSTFSFANAFNDTGKLQFGATAITTTAAASPGSEAATPATFSFTNTLGNMAKTIAAADSVSGTISTGTVTTTANVATTVAATSASSTQFAGFGGLSSALPQSTTTATVTTTTTSIFAAATPTVAAAIPTTTATTQSIFGGTSSFISSSSTPAPFAATSAVDLSTPSTNVFGAASSTAVATTAAPVMGMFGNAAATTTTTTTASDTGLFSSIPKPAFGQSPPSGFFAAAAQATSPVAFGSNTPATNPTANTAGSIFGGNVGGGFGSPTSNNVFGGAATATTAFGGNTSAGSIFSGGPAKPAEGGNLFAAAAAGNNSSGGSIFGQSSFGQTPAPAFGNAFAAKPNAASTGFGTSGSIFGGAAQNTGVSGGSMFGGFGGVTTGAFGSSPGSPGSFAQGGASVAQTGFGSPTSASGFTKPVFGGGATFGSPPAFGAQPSFGGAPLFGSPKGFGSFAAPAANAQPTSPFAAATNKDNIFETLGSSDSGLSFGNLAQNTNAAPKPAFGGSSFMNYRA